MSETAETNTPASEPEQPQATPDVEGYAEQATQFRIQRNRALREAHCYRTMLEMHGIDPSVVTEPALDALPVHDGRVDGKFDYKPPKINHLPPSPTQRVEGEKKIPTLEEVKKWSPETITKNWPIVEQALKQGE